MRIFIQLLRESVWGFIVGVLITVYGVAQVFYPKLDILGLGWDLKTWIILVLSAAMVGLALAAVKRITELRSELVDVDIIIETDSELYLGRPIVYILIVNNENFDIRDCYANLSVLDYKRPHDAEEQNLFGSDFRWINALTFINLNRHKLRWPAFRFGNEKVLRSGRENRARVDIATIEEGKPVFLFETENTVGHETFLNYYLVVEFGGYANGKQIRRKKFCGNLRFDFRDNKANVYLHPTVRKEV